MTCSKAVPMMVSTMSRAAFCALLGLCLLTGFPPRAGAAVASSYVVTRTADDTLPGSLRYAIAQAAGTGGTVTFAIPNTDPGYSSAANTDTVTLTLGPLVVPASLTIAAPAAPSTTVVVSGGTGASQSNVFSVTGGTVAFSNLTITQGLSSFSSQVATAGGGIRNTAALTLTGCVLTRNSTDAGSGGGISNEGASASLTMTGCTVSNNFGGGSPNASGGGIFNSGTLTATRCLITKNLCESVPGGGGGVFNSGTATLTGCVLSGNSDFDSAGGGGVFNSGVVTLSACLLTLDYASNGPGGGINNTTGGTLTLSASILNDNGAPADTGGGVCNTGTAQITNCLVVNNYALLAGGMGNTGTLTLTNSTFTSNWAKNSSSTDLIAGGLVSGPATLTNDIFYLDISGGMYNPGPSEIAAATGTAGPTLTFSDVQGGYAGAGNIGLDPQFVHDPNLNTYPVDPGDEHLQTSSPAAHAGTNGPGIPTTDIEGKPRPAPPATPSMGAYELPGLSAQGGFLITGTPSQSTGSQVVAEFLPGTMPGTSFTAAISFGDGSAPVAGTIAPDPSTAGLFDVTGSHTYAAAGTFPVTVVISGTGGTPTATVTSTASIQPAADVTSQVSINRGGLVYNRATQRYIQTVTVTKTSSGTLTGPISLALDGLTPGAALVGPTGTTQYAPPAGSPYQNAAATGLAPGTSLSLVLQFTYAGTARFGYAPRVLAGPGAR